ncbi:hypothetical protein SAMCFNEI73_Ch2151 [Sinorhizobium americanum]|uniref:Uncharacterized protein n=1 Tax=Sinorhizobium americanum TaxID=194963 RepID=A0A1L3LN27_9HYPH|nr:hypothetical protein SAMCCGM7_Ch2045 [Sinorhizobium americanum CCGM7]APG91436.1 hypothetical protein SAMCFNEI73_Ch2151 [Sinorhizobium americanum]
MARQQTRRNETLRRPESAEKRAQQAVALFGAETAMAGTREELWIAVHS